MIKKESPNEGTETPLKFCIVPDDLYIKKESPNEGTETAKGYQEGETHYIHKKRIPE